MAPLANVAIMVGSGIAGSILTTYTKVGDVLSGGLEFVKKHGEGGGGAKSSSGQDTAQLMSQVNILREEIQSLTVRPAMVVTSAAKSGSGACTVTAVVVAGVVGYAYIKWKGWKLSDMMFVTKRGLSEACNVVGSQLDQVSDAVVVTKKHLAGRIDLVDSSLDENKQIIEGTRDQVAVINMDLSAFQEDLQSVNLVVQTLESKMGRLESSQDQTVDGIHHLCEFTRKLEPAKNGNVGQVPSSIPASIGSSSERIVRATCLPRPAPRLALEEIPLVAESPRAESPQVSSAAESSRAEEQKGVGSRTWSTSSEGSSHVMSSSTEASMNTAKPTSSSRFSGLRLPGLSFLGASSTLS
ncbi:hypothetical protein SEVIR_3G073900v4 [Setaria viridis]|uniref:DUF1664 domain-containing protein n=2 Tax=Setaria TaxID=4554 RepID=A0A368QD40_SETIT|nr:uncharacterized protein LOC101757947 isoform X2 [Setaria italica]XP_034584822.1 uncharacterized protein LOC117847682 isoform X2 [Setaria viridis]RCV15628.1 hypothetical protein SETIT_3G072300v2 [Setaria italica]TKW24804.1 hypothetical protein SEVIR_3G073900v2 [Setaria viridis]